LEYVPMRCGVGVLRNEKRRTLGSLGSLGGDWVQNEDDS